MIISWNTTRACNLSCVHCYRDAGAAETGELTTAEGKKLLDEIARAGFKIMVFSGGEPLMRPDIRELIAHARKLGLRPVLGTNGILITPETAAGLKEAGAACAGISLDSRDREKHDWFRGYEGAWEETMKGIAACREAGLPFQLHTTVMNWNEDEVTAITDLAVELGAVAHHIFFLVPTGRGKDIEDTTLKTQQYEALLEKILAKQAEVPIELKPTCAPQFMRIARQKGIPMRFTKGCLAGTSYCVILPNGDVHPCPYLPLKAGNVREAPFDAIWRDSALFHELRHQPLKGGCARCGYGDICGGCRARAYYYSDGDYLAEEPWCACGR
ncbi:putative heme d1 biosynthesis radical SAM protein NirJ2 [Anaeroselena agilis]|uniref:Heme d1 biosynthesis radical SAM protein NirJ2 n=1 Tax=Anaeroselena agilis TaxID=3063788 RepID=A0ABU3NYN0_9FIRM|nr:putative heme d1 biosynthesis radical SAM protein NirJ2 [Selenomonadales bacterium 4137-cl]